MACGGLKPRNVNTSGIRWCADRIEWKGLVLPARLDARDVVLAHGLACPVKYVRLVRRKLGAKNRFYAQLVCDGAPSQKLQHTLGQGVVGLDLGPSAIAVVAAQEALLLQVMDALENSGAVVALPSQTTLVTKDSWIDPEKAKAVQAAIEKVRDPGVPGPRKAP